MSYQLKSVAMHVTNECSCKCPMCYYTNDEQIKCEGNINVLKRIALELKKAGVEEINLVGGDPAEYSQIKELVIYLHELGFRVPILSNTHDYKNSSVEEITPYVTSLEGTFHAPLATDHDAFCQKPRAYEIMFNNLKRYVAVKNDDQMVGAVMNVMKHNYNELYNIIESLLEQGLPLNYALIQRIGPAGKAHGTQAFAISREQVIIAFEQIAKINETLGVETVMVDAYPRCVVPEEYHQYMAKCDWGYGTASVDMYGYLSRCAVCDSKENLLGNILQTPVNDIWEKSELLQKFRSKEYLRKECQECEKLSLCGGGCAISCGVPELATDSLLVRSR